MPPLPSERRRPTPAPQQVPCRQGHLDPEQLSRVTGCGFAATIESELEKLRATSWTENLPAIYDLGEAVVLGETVLTSEGAHYLGPRRPSGRELHNIAEYPSGCTLLNSEQGLKYFGHWLRDDVAACELFRGMPDVVSLPLPDWGDCAFYRSAFAQEWPQVAALHTSALTLVRDLGFSLDKADRCRTLRQRLRDRLRPPASSTMRMVYVRRGPTGQRRELANAEELESALVAAGVTILEPEKDTQGFVSRLLDCDIIISVEGSQAAHSIYTLRDGGGILILQPPDRFYNPHHEWARMLGMHYGTTIGETRPQGFHVYPEEVLAMLETLTTAMAGSDRTA